MSKKKTQNADNVVRCYEVTDPTLHQKGYTVYKVTERIIFIDALEQSIKEAVVWRRFNDFRKLHKNLSSLHASLHRREEFPDFPKPQLFHRFEKTVIVERMQSAQDLLNFAGQRHYLVGCKAFKEFFAGAQPVVTSPKSDALLLPEKPLCETGQGSSDPKDAKPLTEFSSGDEQESKLCCPKAEQDNKSSRESLVDDSCRTGADLVEGFWCYRQAQDEASLGGEDDEDGNNESDDDNFLPDILNGTPLTGNSLLTESDLVMFDPLTKAAETNDQHELSNEYLLQSMVAEVKQCDGLPLETDGKISSSSDALSEVPSNVEDEKLELSLSSQYASDLADILSDASAERSENLSSQLTSSDSSSHRSRKKSAVESGKGDLTISPLHQLDDRKYSFSFHGCLPKTSGHLVSPKKSSWTTNLPYFSSQDKTCYIVEAAEQISQAQRSEAAGAYHEAFTRYKYGVETLLKGVQKDCDEKQREAVRKKISVYLKKTEQLYHEHIAVDGEQSHVVRWDLEIGGNLTEVDSSIALLRGSAAELGRYKVVGLLSKVLLVVDTGTDGNFVIKVLHKSSVPLHSQKTIVPTHIPYMVSLVKFFETESAIYLVLQHAAGGTLWNYVGGYFGQFNRADQEIIADIVGDPHEKQLRFGGRKSHNLSIQPGSALASEIEGELSSTASKRKLNGNELPSVGDLKKYEEANSLPLTETVLGESEFLANCCLNEDIENDCPENVLLKSSLEHLEELNEIECNQDFKAILESCKTDINSYSICSEDSNAASLSRLASVSSDQTETVEVDFQTAMPVSGEQVKMEDNSSQFETPVGICVSDSHAPSGLASTGGSQCKSTGHKPLSSEISKAKSDLSLPLVESNLRTKDEAYVTHQRNHLEFREPLKSPSMSRLSSQKSDASSLSNGHRRFRTLSSVFAELDLAADVPGESRHVMHLPEGCICQWAAELVVALSRLHALGIVCRDLHPGNILLGDSGHILLTYFSQWMTVDRPISSEAVNGLYCAPEVSGVSEITAACDWWSLGAILYELFAGQSLRACHPAGITSHSAITLPNHVSEEACALITELLKFNPAERLGSGIGESDDVRSHPFFVRIQWNHLFG